MFGLGGLCSLCCVVSVLLGFLFCWNEVVCNVFGRVLCCCVLIWLKYWGFYEYEFVDLDL